MFGILPTYHYNVLFLRCSFHYHDAIGQQTSGETTKEEGIPLYRLYAAPVLTLRRNGCPSVITLSLLVSAKKKKENGHAEMGYIGSNATSTPRRP